MSTKTKYHCADCNREIDEDEVYETEDGSFYCQPCYYENQVFVCTGCDEPEEKEHQHNVLVVYSPDEVFRAADQKAGLYRVARRPYWMDGMTEAYVIDSAVEFVASLPAGFVEGCYPAGHLCRQCVKKHAPTCVRANKGDQP